MASFVQENSFEIFWCSASWFLVNVVFSGMVSIPYVCYCLYSILCWLFLIPFVDNSHRRHPCEGVGLHERQLLATRRWRGPRSIPGLDHAVSLPSLHGLLSKRLRGRLAGPESGSVLGLCDGGIVVFRMRGHATLPAESQQAERFGRTWAHVQANGFGLADNVRIDTSHGLLGFILNIWVISLLLIIIIQVWFDFFLSYGSYDRQSPSIVGLP